MEMLIYIFQGSPFLDLDSRQTKLITGKLLDAHPRPCPPSGHGATRGVLSTGMWAEVRFTSGPRIWRVGVLSLPSPSTSTHSKDSGDGGAIILNGPESLKDCVELTGAPTVTGMWHARDKFYCFKPMWFQGYSLQQPGIHVVSMKLEQRDLGSREECSIQMW